MKEQYKKESPVLSLLGMGGGGTGTALGGLTVSKTYVDDVFSTYLYDGNGSTQSINNGIDLAGEGGLVWFKKRNNSTYAGLWDTERGVTKRLRPDETDSESTASNLVTSFNSNGVSISATGGTQINNNNDDYASWTFRKAPGFFDVVTYTGNNTAGRTVAHNLGSVPGMILVKCLNDTEGWHVYHRSVGATKYLQLNNTNAENSGSTVWNNTTPTSTHFTVSTNPATNGVGKNYVAYIFAHDDAQFGTDGDESIIKCGSYTGDGSTNDTKKITLGFEPQFVLIKRTSITSGWYMHDNMRGIASGGYDPYLLANSANGETTDKNVMNLHPDGFSVIAGEGHNSNGASYIYMAIRRPNKPPEVGTDVFAIGRQGEVNSGSLPSYHSNFVVDMHFTKDVTSSNDNFNGARLLGENYLKTNATTAVTSRSWYDYDYMDGWGDSTNVNTNFYSWMFKRAPGFFDVVHYSGNDTAGHAISHNLKTTPELMIIKSTTDNEGWPVYHSSYGATKYVRINNDSAAATSDLFWNNTAPTSSVFSVGNYDEVNGTNKTYIAYLFATLTGISKVGSYTGTGNAINVPCGFTNGARFVMIKRSDSSGDWYLWDSVRGIVSGNDPYILLNSTAAQVTNTDYVDPLTSGFTVTASAPAALNASGGTYLFLAIA